MSPKASLGAGLGKGDLGCRCIGCAAEAVQPVDQFLLVREDVAVHVAKQEVGSLTFLLAVLRNATGTHVGQLHVHQGGSLTLDRSQSAVDQRSHEGACDRVPDFCAARSAARSRVGKGDRNDCRINAIRSCICYLTLCSCRASPFEGGRSLIGLLRSGDT